MSRLLTFFLWICVALGQVVPGSYILELEGEPVAAYTAKVPAASRREAALERRAEIQAQQQRVVGAVEPVGAEVIASVATVANALLIRVPDAVAGSLTSVPGVVRVHPVREMRVQLDHALPLHHIPDAWLQVGTSPAGKGMKIAIFDTGIDHEHPAFQDSSLTMPSGFPRGNSESELVFTNNKIIVARSYEHSLGRNPEATPLDRFGHGTGVAMAAAGVPNVGPLGPITGVAPGAWLGNYNVGVGATGGIRTDFVLKALDDALSDGMDVINMSFGDTAASRTQDDILVAAVTRATEAGVVVVASAGNDGPDPNTISSPATATSAIAVGASHNDRTFVPGLVTVQGTAPYSAIPGSGPNTVELITAPLGDVSALDGNGLACEALPAESLNGRIAFILRGECFFEEKLANTEAAGAVAALVYTDSLRPEAAAMDVGAVLLPALMFSYADGAEVKLRLDAGEALQATLSFTTSPLSVDPDRAASFSSRGPFFGGVIKPDLLAVGVDLYTATQDHEEAGYLYDPDGYTDMDGTSFSAPIVSGAAALLKQARPGLSVAQYRSLLINSATPIQEESGRYMPVQTGGSGGLNLDAAFRSTVTVSPTSLSFGIGASSPDIRRSLTISNVGTAEETFVISVLPNEPGQSPSVSTNFVHLQPGASQELTVRFASSYLALPFRMRARPSADALRSRLPASSYEGFLRIRATTTNVETYLPYWYVVPLEIAHHLTVLQPPENGHAGTSVPVYFRVTDANGVPVSDISPTATSISAGTEILEVRSIDAEVPGAFEARVLLASEEGLNRVLIRAGSLVLEVVIEGVF